MVPAACVVACLVATADCLEAPEVSLWALSPTWSACLVAPEAQPVPPEASLVVPEASLVAPEASLVAPEVCLVVPKACLVNPETDCGP